jgi:dTDP-4-amino-4,6-dideoxygalactose transaminase
MKVTDKICERILSLPIYPELHEETIEKIITALKTFNIGELR